MFDLYPVAAAYREFRRTGVLNLPAHRAAADASIQLHRGIEPAASDFWLDCEADPDSLLPLLHRNARKLVIKPVSRAVKDLRDDNPALLQMGYST